MNARHLLRSALAVTAAVTLSSGVMATSAQAVPPADNVVDTLTFVGSETTMFFDEQFCADINANAYANNPGNRDKCANILAFAVPGVPSSETAPADPKAPACTWFSTPATDPAPGATCPADGNETAPAGSGAGNTRLLAAASGSTLAARSIVDVGRSSSDQCTGKGVLTQTCYAFARDGLGWGEFRSQSFSMTVAQIQGVYNCSITNWSQIPNAGTGPIKRFFPQSGSGTASFFVANYLNGQDPRTTSYAACGGISVPAANQVAENDASVVPVADRPAAFLPYSASSLIAQVRDQPGFEVPDVIASTGFRIGGVRLSNNTVINPVNGQGTANPTPNPAAFNEGSAFPGSRYVFHNVDSRLGSFNAALHYVGTTVTGSPQRSVLCNNASGSAAAQLVKNRIIQYGFQPLPVRNGVDPAFWGTCRVIAGS